MKYICTKDDVGIEEIFTFPKSVSHDVMYRTIACIGDGSPRVAISAGFISKAGHCHGDSFSLGISSREVDTSIFRKQCA